MSSMGTPTGNPAISDCPLSLASPSTSATSVEVPPISNEIIRSDPLRRAMAAAPTTPPAGPESTVRTGSRTAELTAVMPPFDCITNTRDSPPAVRDSPNTAPSPAANTHSPPPCSSAHTRETRVISDAKPTAALPTHLTHSPLHSRSSDSQTKTATTLQLPRASWPRLLLPTPATLPVKAPVEFRLRCSHVHSAQSVNRREPAAPRDQKRGHKVSDAPAVRSR